MGKVKFVGRGEIHSVIVKYVVKLIDNYFDVCCKYSVICIYILEVFCL